MNALLIILLGYVLPLVICLTVHAIFFWSDVEAIKDLLFPYEGFLSDCVWLAYYIPGCNIFIIFMYIVMAMVASICIFVEKTKIGDAVNRILSIRIKKNETDIEKQQGH